MATVSSVSLSQCFSSSIGDRPGFLISTVSGRIMDSLRMHPLFSNICSVLKTISRILKLLLPPSLNVKTRYFPYIGILLKSVFGSYDLLAVKTKRDPVDLLMRKAKPKKTDP